MERAELQKRIAEMVENSTQNGGSNPGSQIPRPDGTAGTHFSIQEAMGLAGSQKRYETYKAIQVRIDDPLLVTSHALDVEQRNLRDLTLNARINWEVPWAQVPAREKAKLFEVVSTNVKDHRMRMLDEYCTCRHAINTHFLLDLSEIGLRRRS
jgi:hypothetical protein